jgi:hypothetical protein
MINQVKGIPLNVLNCVKFYSYVTLTFLHGTPRNSVRKRWRNSADTVEFLGKVRGYRTGHEHGCVHRHVVMEMDADMGVDMVVVLEVEVDVVLHVDVEVDADADMDMDTGTWARGRAQIWTWIWACMDFDICTWKKVADTASLLHNENV